MIPLTDVWLDGRIVPREEGILPVMTHALHYAGAVYEGMRSYDGAVFELEGHVERLAASAAHLGFELLLSVEMICEETRRYLTHLGLSDAYIRTIAWRGEAVGVGGDGAQIHLAMTAWDWSSPHSADVGINLAWARWRRPSPETLPVKAKCSTVYTIGTLASIDARKQGADDALFVTHDGRLADVTGANIFLVKGSTLLTPIADSFLGGITRQTILEGAHELDLMTEVRHIDPSEVVQADEAFVCGTAYEVVPIRSVDGHTFCTSQVAQTVRNWYLERVRGR